jgi:hypothetical protein
MVFFTLFCWTRRHFRKSDKIGLFITKLPHQISRRIMRMIPALNGVTHTWKVSIWLIRYVEAFMEGKALQGTTRRHSSRQTINLTFQCRRPRCTELTFICRRLRYAARSCMHLTFWRRNYFLILAHPVYKMWIIQEPNNLELWNKLHFEEKKTESIHHV